MPKRLKKATDETVTPPHGDPFQQQLSAYMAKLGAKGGKIGGKRRLETMSAAQRRSTALKAARARWGKRKGSPDK
jgi:hypothetical protein